MSNDKVPYLESLYSNILLPSLYPEVSNLHLHTCPLQINMNFLLEFHLLTEQILGGQLKLMELYKFIPAEQLTLIPHFSVYLKVKDSFLHTS